MRSLLARRLDTLIARYKLRHASQVGTGPEVRGRVWIHGAGEIRIGDHVVFDGSFAPIELHAWKGASITIDDACRIDGGASIEATQSIRLGARARIGAFCKVMDNHFHPLFGNRHARPSARPVVVEQDVELGARSVLLAGAHVGRGANVRAGSVVSRRIAPHAH